MIVFLDIDGVIKLDWDAVSWDKQCIQNLNMLTHVLDLKYIITSTWRINNTKEVLQDIFIKQGIIGEIIDYTPVLDQEDRGVEICAWLKLNPQYSEWICLDDKISDIINYIDNRRIFECDFLKGLTLDIVNKIINKFKNNEKSNM